MSERREFDQGHEPERRHVTDFEGIIEGLRRAGLPINTISARTGIPRSTLIGYLLGSSPPHDSGERLIELWLGVTNSTREQLPRRLWLPSAAQVSR